MNNYDLIVKAEHAEDYLEVALRKGRTAAAHVKRIQDKLLLQKAREKDRIRSISTSLRDSLMHVHDGFPSFDQMSEFALHIFELDMDSGKVKNALGGVHSATHNVQALVYEHVDKITNAKGEDTVKRVTGQFLGRVASMLKQVDKHLLILNEARAIFRKMPSIDESLFTVAIAGFPNVGKSTLLAKITSANPDIQPYAFTTKGLNVGYLEYKYNKIQCIDTPGTLNRATMNPIEQKADIANRYLAQMIIYVFDPTEASAPLQDQKRLHATLKKLGKPMQIYISKTDITPEEQYEELLPAHTSADTLQKEIIKEFKDWL